MAFSFLSRFRIRDDLQREFVALAREMEVLSRQEPGTLHYKFFRLSEPGMFAVHESFVDEAADEAHMAYDHNKALIEKIVGCMDGSYERELLFDLDAEMEGQAR
ncbi:antibiotic biosynthesis monooxygenase [Novosphingobium barchaimii LL02]|uniref:Antibiotic biosynthesis monooxygenase n=1 Tax=Novosphingobium barchaimii LL02 TaxID=1114963 RepID=A0A0J7XY09_9SPHN|nr:antibiotic biosynthesis monooxygenase [Novosphingobium barchaimii]KMS56429.1 antibiotic biosynthesis monooxygenase [Novosphingobium barchaimii LL02]